MADNENCEQPDPNNSQNTTPPLDPNNPSIVRPEKNMPKEKSSKGSYDINGFTTPSQKKPKTLGSFNSTSKSYEQIYMEALSSKKIISPVDQVTEREEKDPENVGETYDTEGKRFVDIKNPNNRDLKGDKDVNVPNKRVFKYQEIEEEVIHRTKEENAVEIEFNRPKKYKEEALNTPRESKNDSSLNIETNRQSKFTDSNLETDRTAKTENLVSTSSEASPKITNEQETKFTAPSDYPKTEDSIPTQPYIQNYKIFNAENITTNVATKSPKTDELIPENIDPDINKSEEEFPITVTGLEKTEESFPVNLDPGIEKTEEILTNQEVSHMKSEKDLGVQEPGITKDENSIPVRDPGLEKSEEDLGVRDPGLEKGEKEIKAKDPGIEKEEEDLGVSDPGIEKEEVIITEKENPNSETETNKAEYFDDAEEINTSSISYVGKEGYRINILKESSNGARNETIPKVDESGNPISWEDGLNPAEFSSDNEPVSSINSEGISVNKNIDLSQTNSQYRYGNSVRYEKFDGNMEGYSQSSEYWREMPERERIYNSGIDNTVDVKQGIETRNSNTNYDGWESSGIEKADGVTGDLMVWSNYTVPTDELSVSSFTTPIEPIGGEGRFTVKSNFNYSDRQYTYQTKLNYDGEDVNWDDYKKDSETNESNTEVNIVGVDSNIISISSNFDYSLQRSRYTKYDGKEDRQVVWTNYDLAGNYDISNPDLGFDSIPENMDFLSVVDANSASTLNKNIDYSEYDSNKYSKLDGNTLDDILWTNYEVDGIGNEDTNSLYSTIDSDTVASVINRNINYDSFETRTDLDDFATYAEISSSEKESSYDKESPSSYDEATITRDSDARKLDTNLLFNLDYSNIDSSAAEAKWDWTTDNEGSFDDIDISSYTQEIPDDVSGFVVDINYDASKDPINLTSGVREQLSTKKISYDQIFTSRNISANSVAIKNSAYETEVDPDVDIDLNNLGSPVDFYGGNDFEFNFQEEISNSRDIKPGDGQSGGTQVLRNLLSSSGISSALSDASNIINNFGDIASAFSGGAQNFAAELNNDYLNVMRRTLTTDLPSILMSFKQGFDVMGASANGQLLESILDGIGAAGDLSNTAGNIMNHPGAAIANMLRGDGTIGDVFSGGKEDAVNALTQGTTGRHGGFFGEDILPSSPFDDNRFSDYDINDSFAVGSSYWNVIGQSPLSLNVGGFGGLFGSDDPETLYNKDLIRDLAQANLGDPNFTTRSLSDQLGISREATHKSLISAFQGIYEESFVEGRESGDRSKRIGSFNINSNRAGNFYGVKSDLSDNSNAYSFGGVSERDSIDYRSLQLNRRLFVDEIESFNAESRNRDFYNYIESNYNNEIQSDLFGDLNYFNNLVNLLDINLSRDEFNSEGNDDRKLITNIVYDSSADFKNFYTNNFIENQSSMSFSNVEDYSINLQPYHINGSILRYGPNDAPYDPHLITYNIPIRQGQVDRDINPGRFLGPRGVFLNEYQDSDNILYLNGLQTSNEVIENMKGQYSDRVNYIPVKQPDSNIEFYSNSLGKFFNTNEYVTYSDVEEIDPHLKEVSSFQNIVNDDSGSSSSKYGGKDLFYKLNSDNLILFSNNPDSTDEQLRDTDSDDRSLLYSSLYQRGSNLDIINNVATENFDNNAKEMADTSRQDFPLTSNIFNISTDVTSEDGFPENFDPHFVGYQAPDPNNSIEIGKYIGARGRLEYMKENQPDSADFSNLIFFNNINGAVDEISSKISSDPDNKKFYVATNNNLNYGDTNFYDDWITRNQKFELDSSNISGSENDDPHLKLYNVGSTARSMNNIGGRGKFLEFLNDGENEIYTLFSTLNSGLNDDKVKSLFDQNSYHNLEYDTSNVLIDEEKINSEILWRNLNPDDDVKINEIGQTPRYYGYSKTGEGTTQDTRYSLEEITPLILNIDEVSVYSVPSIDGEDPDPDQIGWHLTDPTNGTDYDILTDEEIVKASVGKLGNSKLNFDFFPDGNKFSNLFEEDGSLGLIGKKQALADRTWDDETNSRGSVPRPLTLKKPLKIENFYEPKRSPEEDPTVVKALGVDSEVSRMDFTDLGSGAGINDSPGTREGLLANINLKFKKGTTGSHFKPIGDDGEFIDSPDMDFGEGYLSAIPYANSSITNDAIFKIPFQSQAEINGEQRAADWATETTVGRTSEFYIWSKTNTRTIQFKTTYIATSPYSGYTPDANFQEYAIWTSSYINNIINKYRSLILPMSHRINSSYNVSPPVVVLAINNYLMTASNANIKRYARWYAQDINIDPKYEFGYTETRDPMGYDVTITFKEIFDWADMQSWEIMSDRFSIT